MHSAKKYGNEIINKKVKKYHLRVFLYAIFVFFPLFGFIGVYLCNNRICFGVKKIIA
jgi:hypothetical protein